MGNFINYSSLPNWSSTAWPSPDGFLRGEMSGWSSFLCRFTSHSWMLPCFWVLRVLYGKGRRFCGKRRRGRKHFSFLWHTFFNYPIGISPQTDWNITCEYLVNWILLLFLRRQKAPVHSTSSEFSLPVFLWLGLLFPQILRISHCYLSNTWSAIHITLL